MKDGDTVRHDSHGLVEVVKVYWNPLVEEDMAVIRAKMDCVTMYYSLSLHYSLSLWRSNRYVGRRLVFDTRNNIVLMAARPPMWASVWFDSIPWVVAEGLIKSIVRVRIPMLFLVQK